MQPEVKTHGLFPSLVAAEAWAEAPQWNRALGEAILARRRVSGSVSKSNVLGWQSDLAMTQWGGEAAQRLKAHVLQRCDELTHDPRGPGHFRWYAEMWANMSPTGASNQTHSHPGSFWSAVYYVDDGFAGSPDKALGGELVFVDPRFPMVRARTPDLRYRAPDGSTDHQEVWFRPRSGVLVIFPSWLMHGVRAYQGRGTRISIAINVCLTRLGAVERG